MVRMIRMDHTGHTEAVCSVSEARDAIFSVMQIGHIVSVDRLVCTSAAVAIPRLRSDSEVLVMKPLVGG